MSDKSTHRIHRNWDEAERQRHGQQVQQRFAREREDRYRKVQDTIEVMLTQGVTISQNEVARAAGVSIGFINKHLRDVVEKAKRQQQKAAGTLHTVRQLTAETKELERLRLMNRRLREQLDEQRRANKQLLAQVARVIDLEDEVELLRTQNRELLATLKVSQEKVAHLPDGKTQNQIEVALERIGIELSPGIRKEIKKHSLEAVLRAIKAFEQYSIDHFVLKPDACLSDAIREEWKPNVTQESTSPEECEFDEWYAEAIQQGFVLDMPKNHLGVVMGEIQVKLKDSKAPSGYINMGYREARAMVEKQSENF